jgi:fructose-bisphosphate aldolase class II
MGLVSLHQLFNHATRYGYALGYFEAWDSYSLEAVVEAAEAEQSPAIIGFGGMMLDRGWLDASGVEMLGRMGRVVAERARVPVALILNEAQTFEQATHGLDAGFNIVMLDTSLWAWNESIAKVSELVKLAHARGAAVEAELGRLPDFVEGSIDSSASSLTDPAQAAQFVQHTGVDCLAVSIGNVHLFTAGHAPVDMLHLEAIHAQVPVPLVIHGGTSFPPAAVPQAIRAGALKFNFGTGLKRAFFEGIRETMSALGEQPHVHDVMGSHKATDLMTAGKARMTVKVREWMRTLGSSGKA